MRGFLVVRGLFVLAVVAAAEARLHDTANAHRLGGDTRVQFFHSLVILIIFGRAVETGAADTKGTVHSARTAAPA